MALSWKSFDFFDVDLVKLADDEIRSILESNEISCVCAGSANLFLGSDTGHVRIVGPAGKSSAAFEPTMSEA